MQSIKAIIIFPVFCIMAQAAYTSKATVSFAAASGSTQTNITLAFTGSDVKLKVVGSGGQIQHTATRAGVTVPTDFVLTNDATCATLTGSWNWGIEFYDGTAGTIKGWAKVASLTTGAPVAPTVCIGNAAVSTYQGGAVGAEFDSSTAGVWHYPDGTTLSALDFSAAGNNGTVTLATGGAGQVDGAAVFPGNSYIDVAVAAISGFTSATFSAWINTTNSARQMVMSHGLGVCGSGTQGFGSMETRGGGTAILIGDGGDSGLNGTVNILDGAWHRLTGVYTPTSLSIQVDGGTVQSTGSLTNPAIGGTPGLEIGNVCTNFSSGAFNYVGSIDEIFISNVARSADWSSTEYANQLSPPAISAFTPLATSTVTSQGFVF